MLHPTVSSRPAQTLRRSASARVERGFTLIELMVVVAIVAILGSVAMPAYNDYIRRGQVQEAFGAMSDYRVKLEQYYQDHRNYGQADGTACANSDDAPGWANFVATSAPHFTFSCALSGAGSRVNQGYTLTATGVSGTAVANHVYTINNDNLRRTTQFKGTTVSKNCWVAKGSEC